MALFVEYNPNMDIDRAPKHFIVTGGTTKPTVASHDVLPEPTIGSTCWDATNNILYKTYDGTNWVAITPSATQAALDLKAPLASPVFTGNPTIPNPVINGTVTTTGLTMPAHTLNGALCIAGSLNPGIYTSDDTGGLRLQGGNSANSAYLYIYSKSHGSYPGGVRLGSTDASGNAKEILTISGNLATGVATWANVTHTGLVISSAAGILITPSGAAASTEGMLYYDSTAHKLKIRTASGYETVTSA